MTRILVTGATGPLGVSAVGIGTSSVRAKLRMPNCGPTRNGGPAREGSFPAAIT